MSRVLSALMGPMVTSSGISETGEDKPGKRAGPASLHEFSGMAEAIPPFQGVDFEMEMPFEDISLKFDELEPLEYPEFVEGGFDLPEMGSGVKRR